MVFAATLVVVMSASIIMMVTPAGGLSFLDKPSFEQGLDQVVALALCPGIAGDSGCLQGGDGSASDSSCDDDIDVQPAQKAGEGSMALAVCPDYLAVLDRVRLDRIDGELLALSKVLEHHLLLIGY